MLLGGLWAILKALLLAFLFFFPTYTPPPPVSLSVFQAADFVLPLSEIVVWFTAVITLVGVTLGWTGVNWTTNKIRGSG